MLVIRGVYQNFTTTWSDVKASKMMGGIREGQQGEASLVFEHYWE